MITFILAILYFHRITDSLPARPTIQVSYALPENRYLKKSLGYIEDTYLNFTELTTKYGYPSEHHTVITDDGYQLTIFRILTNCSEVQRYPVILGHGINDSSDAWILTGPETGLAYILSNNCYDVWPVNYRGNVYSRKHLRLDPNKDPAYWEYSFDENGNYDLPAIIDYVIDVTKRARVYYIGHSQGTTDFFVMGSLRPDYNKKVQLSIQLAPVAWMKNVRSPFSKIISREAKELRRALQYVGFNELFAKHQISHALTELLCQFAPNEICGTALAISTGYKLGSITPKNLAVAMGHLLVGVSSKTLTHFAQSIVSGKFQRYDEGREDNIRRYGSIRQPNYQVSLITSPVILFSAANDWLSTLEDIDILSSKLPNLVENYIVPELTWSHNNHIWGINATELVFKKILEYFDVFNTYEAS